MDEVYAAKRKWHELSELLKHKPFRLRLTESESELLSKAVPESSTSKPFATSATTPPDEAKTKRLAPEGTVYNVL